MFFDEFSESGKNEKKHKSDTGICNRSFCHVEILSEFDKN